MRSPSGTTAPCSPPGCAPSPSAAALDGAYGLAAVALDWLHDADLRRAVRADFEVTGGAIDVAGFWEE